jgi:hypothetical protein
VVAVFGFDALARSDFIPAKAKIINMFATSLYLAAQQHSVMFGCTIDSRATHISGLHHHFVTVF